MQIPLLPHWNLQPPHKIRNTPEQPQNSPYRAKTQNQYNFIATSENAIQPQIKPHTEITPEHAETFGRKQNQTQRRKSDRRQTRKN